MALTHRYLFRCTQSIRNITKPLKLCVEEKYTVRFLFSRGTYPSTSLTEVRQISLSEKTFSIRCCSSDLLNKNTTYRPILDDKLLYLWQGSFREFSSNTGRSDPQKPCIPSPQSNKSQPPDPPQEAQQEKMGVVKTLKTMYRDYWYVVLPVHLVTSAVWFGSFYYAVRSGLDVIAFLNSLGVSETILSTLRHSGAGYFALAFALYKLATPLRYTVTIGSTTYAIKKLKSIGWIKPVPSRERLKEMIQEKKTNIQDRYTESKQHMQSQIKDKHTHVMDEMRRYRAEMRNMKNKLKKM